MAIYGQAHLWPVVMFLEQIVINATHLIFEVEACITSEYRLSYSSKQN